MNWPSTITTGKGGGVRIRKRIGGKRWGSKFVLSRDEIDKERRKWIKRVRKGGLVVVT